MALARCNKCGCLHELEESLVGQEATCSKCGMPIRVFRTLFFVETLLKRHMEALRKLQQLQPTMMPIAKPQALHAIDLFNTDYFASEAQHQSIKQWFAQKKHANPDQSRKRGYNRVL